MQNQYIIIGTQNYITIADSFKVVYILIFLALIWFRFIITVCIEKPITQ
jgi:hypothetical protein